MIISARTESSTARFTCASVISTPFSTAFCATFTATFAGVGSSGHCPSSACTRSPPGVGGQSVRAQEGPWASAFTSISASPSSAKNACHAASTAFGSLAYCA
jgi:hypothetical protein